MTPAGILKSITPLPAALTAQPKGRGKPIKPTAIAANCYVKSVAAETLPSKPSPETVF